MVSRGRRRTILLVEDEEKVRKLTVLMLERHGFRVLEAGNGYEALEICRAEDGAIDLVLSDIVMPQMSGDRLAAVLCELYPSLKVLFMSGYSEHAVVNQALLAPDVQFVSKPFTASSLLNKVNQALNAGGQVFGNRRMIRWLPCQILSFSSKSAAATATARRNSTPRYLVGRDGRRPRYDDRYRLEGWHPGPHHRAGT